MLQILGPACLYNKWHQPHLGQANTDSGIHQWVVVPSLRWIYDDAEDAHEAGTKSLKALYQFGLHPRERGKPDDAGDLEVEVSQSCHSNHLDAVFEEFVGFWPHVEEPCRDISRY